MKIRRQYIVATIVGSFFFIPGLVLSLYLFPSKNWTDTEGTTARFPIIEWHNEFRGELYAIQVYPRSAHILGRPTAKGSDIAKVEFMEERFTIGGRNYWRTRKTEGIHPVTAITIAGQRIENLIRLEYVLIIVGLLIVILPSLPWARERLNKLARNRITNP
ncbi:MAG: hypothetical protein ACSHYB_00110 [Roseibacillus sp.]